MSLSEVMFHPISKAIIFVLILVILTFFVISEVQKRDNSQLASDPNQFAQNLLNEASLQPFQLDENQLWLALAEFERKPDISSDGTVNSEEQKKIFDKIKREHKEARQVADDLHTYLQQPPQWILQQAEQGFESTRTLFKSLTDSIQDLISTSESTVDSREIATRVAFALTAGTNQDPTTTSFQDQLTSIVLATDQDTSATDEEIQLLTRLIYEFQIKSWYPLTGTIASQNDFIYRLLKRRVFRKILVDQGYILPDSLLNSAIAPESVNRASQSLDQIIASVTNDCHVQLETVEGAIGAEIGSFNSLDIRNLSAALKEPNDNSERNVESRKAWVLGFSRYQFPSRPANSGQNVVADPSGILEPDSLDQEDLELGVRQRLALYGARCLPPS
jgi:hypothetical protein